MVDFNDPNFLLADIDPAPKRELAKGKASRDVKGAIIGAILLGVAYGVVIACSLKQWL